MVNFFLHSNSRDVAAQWEPAPSKIGSRIGRNQGPCPQWVKATNVRFNSEPTRAMAWLEGLLLSSRKWIDRSCRVNCWRFCSPSAAMASIG